MKIGLIGLPSVGKSTLFKLLTNTKNELGKYGAKETNIGMAKVPDRRIDFLSKMYNPKKTTYAQIEFIDIGGVIPNQGAGKFLEEVRECDAIVHVVRAFTNGEIPHIYPEINPLKDLETVDSEILFSDLELIDKRLERIKAAKKLKPEQADEAELLKRIYLHLENGEDIRQFDLNEEEEKQLRAYQFLTEKPKLVVINLDEEQFKKRDYPFKRELLELCQEKEIQLVEVCGKIEAEMIELEKEDLELFMEDLGLEETGVERLARAVYAHLGLISFITSGEDEVKSWTIKRETTARKAAGKIHSDIERGFIRAEVVKYEDLSRLGSMSKIKEQGLFRLEGKEYLVQDGDIINFRFNV